MSEENKSEESKSIDSVGGILLIIGLVFLFMYGCQTNDTNYELKRIADKLEQIERNQK